ncbi:LADA_0H16666g1_1 [Lachancea dasiensis]|uniref:LADA_0H16666g1_1 n=1 Tax=Lachancea dasiensis TaxID=1072105 RepID=A0A1G4K5D4_9SACH|nr:LADA_0H16666g1_1 [Lachancea dasiensis]
MSSHVVDKVFDTGFFWFKKVESLNRRIIENVKELGSSSIDDSNGALKDAPHAAADYYHSLGRPQLGLIAQVVGTSAAALLIWSYRHKLLPRPPKHLAQGDKKCILLFGHMRDPITRQIVMDLYRRGFVVFVCSEGGASETDDDGLFHIASSDLSNMIKYLCESSTVLSSILIVPNSAYNLSGAFTTLSTTAVQDELRRNVFTHMHALSKLIPHLIANVQIILLAPSLPRNLGIPHHSPEYLVAGLIESYYKTLRFEYPSAKIYFCHLGLLKIASSSSSYKNLPYTGTAIGTSLLRPLYNLIVSQDSWWFSFCEVLRGKQRFYGKWSMLGYYFGNWLPLKILYHL